MGEDLSIGDCSGYRLAVFVEQDGGHAEDIGSGAASVDFLNGVADGAGDAVGIKGPPLGRSLSEVAGDHGNGVVTAFAVAGELDALAFVEEVDVAEIPLGAVGVGVRGLTPLMLGLLMTVAAVLGGGKGLGINEFTGIGGHEGGQEMSLVAEMIVIFFCHLRTVGSSSGRSFVGFAAGDDGTDRQRGCQGEREIKCAHDY